MPTSSDINNGNIARPETIKRKKTNLTAGLSSKLN
jgi:hypothetical protein